MNDTVKILIADKHPAIRSVLSELINSETNFEVVGEAETGEIALQKTEALAPDILILDIDVSEIDGFEVAKILNNNFPKVKIVLLSIYHEKEILNLFFMINLQGFIIKDSLVLEIIDCLNAVSNGEIYISPIIKVCSNSTKEISQKEDNFANRFSNVKKNEIQILGDFSLKISSNPLP